MSGASPSGWFRAGTVRGRAVRSAVALVRSVHPVASRRVDPGFAAEAMTGRFPYRRWLRLQRRRRARHAAPCAGDPRAHAPPAVPPVLAGGRFESDAAALLAAAFAGGAEAVQFHLDAPAAGRCLPVIRGRLGPVAQRRLDPLGPAVALRPGHAADGSDSAEAVRSLDPRKVERVDEVLLHLPTARPPGPAAIDRPAPGVRPVAVVVPSPGNTLLLATLLAGLLDEPVVAEVVVVDNSAPMMVANRFYEEWSARLSLQVLRTPPDEPFNWSRANNLGAAVTTSPVLAFCNDDLEFLGEDTLARLAGWLEVRGVGVVGPQLLYPDGTIQHGGVVIGLNGLAEHAFLGMRPGADTLIGNTDEPRDVSAVTGACLMTTREVFDAVGGFDEELAVTGSDVWFSLQAAGHGWGTAYDGGTALVHHESATRGRADHLDDVIASEARWGDLVDAGDPYWSQLLAIHRHEPTLRRPGDPTSRQMLDAWLAQRGARRPLHNR